ncbi:LPS export ABC transporter permease LptG [Oxalobacter sp. OttesenSCG-928-P03]|nr:LPS export ABC transporter permease LptG [Oxalobacter sp. OttesenSCG-928-P03]
MSILQRYFTSQIMKAVFFVLMAFLALFAFFDLVAEINSVGRGVYKLKHAFAYILLNIPGYIYELMPVAVLIGTIYVLARFASNSEFTIMRASSLSTMQAAWILIRIGLVFMIFTSVIGEFVTPYTATMASEFRDDKLLRDRSMRGLSRTGIWSRDSIYANSKDGEVIGSRYINIAGLRTDRTIRQVAFYEFDLEQQLRRIVTASQGRYLGDQEWELSDVTVETLTIPGKPGETRFPASAPEFRTQKFASLNLHSDLTPTILSVLAVDATKMSAYDLAVYNRHMEANSQDTAAYKIAFWKKIVYPFSIFVMMALALPFAYLHFRSGGISVKIFTGIMIGVLFMLLNSLFSHIGLLNTWPPLLTAILPSIVFLLFACGALWWVERH